MENAARGSDFIRSGNWHGNRTTWRMCLDLNRCLYYSDASGSRFDAPRPIRQVLTVLDGIVAGEGDGPLAPSDVPLGVVLAATDPLAVDLAAVRLMGFDEGRIPKIAETMRDDELRISDVRTPEDVVVHEVEADTLLVRERRLADLRPERPFTAHPGWRGHIEREQT
jgi:hypothetical protein